MAEIAQSYSEICVYSPNPNRSVDSGFTFVGENRGESNFTGDVTTAALESFIQNWYDNGLAGFDPLAGQGGDAIFGQVLSQLASRS